MVKWGWGQGQVRPAYSGPCSSSGAGNSERILVCKVIVFITICTTVLTAGHLEQSGESCGLLKWALHVKWGRPCNSAAKGLLGMAGPAPRGGMRQGGLLRHGLRATFFTFSASNDQASTVESRHLGRFRGRFSGAADSVTQTVLTKHEVRRGRPSFSNHKPSMLKAHWVGKIATRWGALLSYSSYMAATATTRVRIWGPYFCTTLYRDTLARYL